MRHALRDESLTRMLKCAREWNTNGRTCHVAQHVLAAIFRTHSMEELSKLEGIEDIMHACRAYTQRHRSRLNGCIGTFMVDVLLSRTGAIVDDEETEEELRKSRETIDDFGFMRADGAAPPPRLLAPSVPQPIAAWSGGRRRRRTRLDVSDEEMEDDENEDEGEEEEEEEPQAKEEVKEEDIAMGPPKKLNA